MKHFWRFFFGLIFFMVVMGVVSVKQKLKFVNDQIYPNVSIDQINLGGFSKEQALVTLDKLYQKNTHFQVQFVYDQQVIATMSASEIGYTLPIKTLVDQAYLIGRSENPWSAWYQKLALTFNLEQYNFDLNPYYNQKTLDDKLKTLNEAYKIAPQEARFDFSNDKVVAFQLEKKGSELDTKTAIQKLQQKLNSQKNQPQKTITVHLQKIVLEPKNKLSTINNLGIKELVAQGTSSFVGSIAERIYNIQFGASRLNGIIIQPGETFSFNENIGDISAESGFKPAYVIKEGKTVLGDGGGICQVSTTLFRAALNAGLKIVERHAHAYRVGYYEQDAKPGFDATIYTPSVDLKFVNNYDHALLIQTVFDSENLTLTFNLYGTKDDRVISISDATQWNYTAAPPDEYIDDPTLPVGTTKQVDFAASGLSTKFDYLVTKKGKTLDEQTFVSNFKPWKAIFLVGTQQ